MEENEKNNNAVEGEVVDSNKTDSIPNEKIYNKILNFVKKNKKILGVAIIVILALIIIINIITVSPEEAVKGFVKKLNSAHTEQAFEYIDWTGYVVFAYLDEDEYDDFYDEYKDAADDEDYEEWIEYYLDYFDEDYYEDYDDEIKDSGASVKIKRIVDTEKVSKNLYLVTARIQTVDEDGDKDTDNYEFYIMKKGLKSYIVSSDLL